MVENTLRQIWLREAPYRYRVYYCFIAVMLVMPKTTSIVLERSIAERGIWESYTPILIDYGGAAVFGLLAFFYGHFSGYLMRKLLSSYQFADGSEKGFSARYILSFTAGPMIFFVLFELIHLLVARQLDVSSSAPAFAGFASRVFTFSLGMFAIMAIFGALSLRGLRRFTKTYKNLPS